MVVGRMRNFVINKVKAPLVKALVTGKTFSQVMRTIMLVTGRIPELTEERLRFKRTLDIAAIEKKFFEYEDNRGHAPMFQAVIKLLKMETEHDMYYQPRYDVWLEEHILMVLTGEYLPRLEGTPKICWREPEPYGGKHTIIAAIQENREKIIDLLGEKWHWLKEGNYTARRN